MSKYTIGIDLGGTTMTAGLVNENYEIVDHMGHGAPVGEMPRVRRIGHSGRVVSHSQGAVTDFLGRYGHFVKGVVSVGRTQGMGVQVCNHLHGMEKPLLF